MPGSRLVPPAALIVVSVLGTSGVASAYEGQATLELGLGYAAVESRDELPTHGAVATARATLGLGDTFALGAELAYALHPAGGRLHVGVAGVELVYLLDVVELVPYFGLGLDVLATLLDGVSGADAGVHAVGGADYLLSRTLLLGLAARAYYLPLALVEESAGPVYFTLDLHAGVVLDL